MSNPKLLCVFATLFTLASTVSLAEAPEDTKAYLKEHFWGSLYKDGGVTFYCKKPFKKKGFLIDEAYVYSDSWIRDELNCGSPRQCRKNSEKYRGMVTDMHNIYPEQSRFELNRKNARFEELGDRVPTEECDVKRSFDLIEPANDIKGDIARAIFYMHKTYGLPIVGSIDQLKRWNKGDPVSKEEMERNKRIAEIQGAENEFIVNPSLADGLR